MVLVGHAQRVSKPLSRRQHMAVLLVVAAIAGVSIWAIVGAAPGPVSAHGCVNLVVASSTGGSALHACGAAARSWCRQEYDSRSALALRVQQQCRLAGIRRPG
jgi:hypothetical protein